MNLIFSEWIMHSRANFYFVGFSKSVVDVEVYNCELCMCMLCIYI